jgi:hypothetical protein
MHNESHTVGAEQVSQDTLDAFYQVPTFIYSYNKYTDQLHRTSLVTGERSSHQVPHTGSHLYNLAGKNGSRYLGECESVTLLHGSL